MKLLPIRRGEITRTQIRLSVVPVIRGIINASSGPVVEPGPRRRPAEPQIVGSNPTRPAMILKRVIIFAARETLSERVNILIQPSLSRLVFEEPWTCRQQDCWVSGTVCRFSTNALCWTLVMLVEQF